MWGVKIAGQIYPHPHPTPPPPYGSNWGHKIADFVFWPYVSFIHAFKALEVLGHHMWRVEIAELDLTPDPYGSNWGHKIADLCLDLTPDPPAWVKLQ